MSTTRRQFLKAGLLGPAALGAGLAQSAAPKLELPNLEKSFKFAVVGDTGTGGSAQQRVADRMAEMQRECRFEHVLMAGDNMYGGESASSFRRKFEEPYSELLSRGVKFYAALGNHDDPSQRLYEAFNMKGERYYSFRPASDVRFFALDSSYMDERQLSWIEKELRGSDNKWKIPYFHHPLYSSAERHGSELALRETLEPLFVKNGVDVVFTGHDHVYERVKPQQGVAYFVVGSSAKLREGDLAKSEITAAGFDDGYAFLLCEIEGDVLHFQAVSDSGKTIDFGNIAAREAKQSAASGS
jgi:hypothetical protein